MSFDFNLHVKKNFKFLKEIDNFKEVILCSLNIDNENSEYLIPNALVNTKNDNTEKDYFDNDNIIKFSLSNHDDSSSQQCLVVLLDEVDSKIIIDEINLFNQIPNSKLNNAVTILRNWCRDTLLANSFELFPGKEFKLKEEKFDGPKELILTAGPLVTHYENIFCHDAVNNGWNKEWSKYLDTFESSFSEYIGSKYALSTSSCTGALYLSLLACDIKEGDEVIVPELTWVATASAVRYTGATPVFADVDIDTWCIDTENLESLLTEKTKAIIPVHLYGNPSEMKKIMTFAKKNNLKVIEDAAPAIGATYEDKKVGSFGDFGCFSFQGAKLLVTGEGGIVVTSNEELFSKFKKLWDHGRTPGTFWIDELGYKFKMSNLQAAFGLGQLENIELLIESKKRNYERYKNNLSNVSGITLNTAGKNTQSIYWMTSLLLNPETGVNRDNFMKDLRDLKIDTRTVFPSISQYPIWGIKYEENKNSKIISENALNLPSGVMLTTNEIDYISDSVIKLLEK